MIDNRKQDWLALWAMIVFGLTMIMFTAYCMFVLIDDVGDQIAFFGAMLTIPFWQGVVNAVRR